MYRQLAVVLSACSLIACSNQSSVSPVAPSEPSFAPGGGGGGGSNGGVPGIYDLTFIYPVSGAYQEVSSLTVSGFNTPFLKARVTDMSGNPATKGTVTFEYCAYGEPTYNITNPDAVPKEACEQGAAMWAPLDRAKRVGDGSCYFLPGASACEGLRIVRIPRTVGFRFRYTQQGNIIASGTSPARNLEWTAQLP